MKKFVGLVVLAMVVASFSVAQSVTNDAQKLVGTWIQEQTQTPVTLVFNANGTGSFTEGRETQNFFWGLSISGEIYLTGYENNKQIGSVSGNFYLSPDGRRMFFLDYLWQKK